MKALTFNDVLKVEDLPVTQVEVKSWGGTVGVRTLRAKERAELERIALDKAGAKDPGKFRRTLLRMSLANPDGTAFLADDAAATALMEKSATAVEFLFEESLRLNAIGQSDVEELEKN